MLVGPPGSGKSTVGAALAERWHLALRDTDADVEATAGKAISDIFVDDGEPAFRALEHEAVRSSTRARRTCSPPTGRPAAWWCSST